MEATTALLDWMCTKKEQLKIGVLIVSFILGTVDMVTDWINYIQWRSVGGYDQHYFVYIFTTTFLCAATVGTVLWTIEIFLLFHRSWNLFKGIKISLTPKSEGVLKNHSITLGRIDWK